MNKLDQLQNLEKKYDQELILAAKAMDLERITKINGYIKVLENIKNNQNKDIIITFRGTKDDAIYSDPLYHIGQELDKTDIIDMVTNRKISSEESYQRIYQNAYRQLYSILRSDFEKNNNDANASSVIIDRDISPEVKETASTSTSQLNNTSINSDTSILKFEQIAPSKTKEKLTEREKIIAELKIKYPNIDDLCSGEYRKFIDENKGKYKDMPTFLYSFNACFGKTAYIMQQDYTISLFKGDKEKTEQIEEEMRDKWFEMSKEQENQDLRNLIKDLFNTGQINPKDGSQKLINFAKEYNKTHDVKIPEVLNSVLTKLGGLPYTGGGMGYLHAIVSDNIRARYYLENAFIQKGFMSRYSREMSDKVKQAGGCQEFVKYLDTINPNNGNSNGNGSDNRKSVSSKKENFSDNLSAKKLLSMYNEIFPNGDVSDSNYKKFLAQGNNRSQFPAEIYSLNDYFKSFDPYANNSINRIQYTKALFDQDINQANIERSKYMDKIINKGNTDGDIRDIILAVYDYCDKTGDISCCEWNSLLANNADGEKFKNDFKEKHNLKKIFHTYQPMLKYSVLSKDFNFNDIDTSSLMNNIKARVEEIIINNKVSTSK